MLSLPRGPHDGEGGARPASLVEELDTLRRWDAWLAAAGKSDRTREQYRRNLIRFVADTLIPLDDVTEDDVAEYLRSIKQRGKGVDEILSALKSHMKWRRRRGMRPDNPVEDIPYKRRPDPPIQIFEREEDFVRVVIAAAWRNPRRAWAIVLMLETGGRIGSIAGIKTEDLPMDLRAGTFVYFRVAKGDRNYHAPLSPLAVVAIRELLPGANGTLIARNKGTIREWYKQACRDAGIDQDRMLRTHTLRHTFATNQTEKGTDIRVVQQLLNHASLADTQKYLHVRDTRKAAATADPNWGMRVDER